MITVIARWETGQMSPLKEWKMWRQLKGAFGIDRFIFVPVQEYMKGNSFDQYDTMEEALDVADGERVFLEPGGHNSVNDIPQDNIVLVIGNTSLNNMKHARPAQTYRINTAGTDDHNHLYGTNAAAIALAIRHGQ